MALARAVEKIPDVPGKKKRGLLIALEGPTACNIGDTFEKIRKEFADNLVEVTLNVQHNWDIPEEEFRRAIAELAAIQPEIIESLDAGKLVVVHNHMMSVLAAAWRHNVFKCQEMQDVAGARALFSQCRDIIIPDITFLCMPAVETLVTRLVKNGNLASDDDYMYSSYREEAQAFGYIHRFMDDAYDIFCDPLGMENQMLNRIVLSTVTNCFHKKKFYCP